MICHAPDSPPGPFVAIFVAMDGPPGPSMAATDGSLCRKWSPQFFQSCTSGISIARAIEAS